MYQSVGENFVAKSLGNIDCFENKLMMDKKSKVIELAGVTIFPKVGGQDGETIVGTLQFHVNGFIYATSSSDFNVSFLYNNVKKLFFLAEDGKEMPPLLHFHLGCPIKVGTEKKENHLGCPIKVTEKREHIQFRLVPTLVGQRRSDDDSNKIEKEKQSRNEDLKNFVFKVGALDKTYEFHGVGPSKAWSVFGLTSYTLFELVDTPFFVVNLRDIEIVNLAKLEPEKIYMTVVYKEFNRGPLQVNSIPLHSLDGIKQCLNYGNVKYLKKRENSPRKFIDQGGWMTFGLEDTDTLHYYNCHKEFEEFDSDIEA
ncbi:hypothetical protein MKX01_037248 [Papaver californicum]|nr:hypothetical protein MKX01_037248 [Papaver californicum]